MKNLVLFASGSGSNAEKIIEHFKGSDQVQITHIYCNNPTAGIIQRAERLGVPCRVFDRESYKNGTVLKEVQSLRTDWIILAGFLWLIPADFVKAFPQRIVNIHPALLPKFGGKGMYGHFVHEAVHAAGEKESGITIHFVNEHYDEGNIIFQAKCQIESSDGPKEIEHKVRALEIQHLPSVIASLLVP